MTSKFDEKELVDLIVEELANGTGGINVSYRCKGDFVNETMKKSVNTYMAQEVDKSEEISVNFRAQLSENVSLVVNLFESEDMANKWREGQMNPKMKDIKQMGAKVEFFEGPISHFNFAGHTTLDMLSKGIDGGPKR